MTIVKFRVTSISPLLMHNPAGMARTGEGFGKKTIPTPEAEAKRSVYQTGDGQLYIEATAFRSSILDACMGRRIDKVAAKGRLQGALFCLSDRCLLRDPETEKAITEYVIDTRRAVVQRSGVMRSRARVNSWQADVAFEYDPEMLSPKAVSDVFQLAGRTCGVLDYRPKGGAGKGGPFGRYEIELLDGSA